MVELYTSEESNLHLLLRALQNYSSKIIFVSKLKEGALPVISALSLQVYQKLFKHKGEGTMLRKGKELGQWDVRAKRGKGAGRKRNLLYSTAAWPAFFQCSAINRAAAGSPVLLVLAICCLFWPLYCPVPALPVPAGLQFQRHVVPLTCWWLSGTSTVQ